MVKYRILVTSGYVQSLHSLAITELLRRDGHEIVGILVVKTFQLSRLKKYYKQYGFEIMRKKFESLVIRKAKSSLTVETNSILQLIKDNKINERNLIEFSKNNNISIYSIKSLNHHKTVNIAEILSPDLIIYAGGGIMKSEIIETAKIGVLNAHSGRLPFWRGMNVIEWSILYGYKPYTTVHFIDKGIDTGKILYIEELPIGLENTLEGIRGIGTSHNVQLLKKVVDDLEQLMEKSIEQATYQGRQFFVMHDFLKDICKERLRNGVALND
jgi:methionyl-tRNA formyltransferase